MAAAAVLPAMNGDGEKNIHPFFQRTNGCHEAATTCTEDEAIAQHEEIELEQQNGAHEEKPKVKRGRKPKAQDGKKQKTLQEIVNPKAKEVEPINGTGPQDVVDLCTSDAPANQDTPRRKRRRTSQFESKDVGNEQEIANSTSDAVQAVTPPRRRVTRSEVANSTSHVPLPSSPRVIIPASSPLPQQAHTEEALLEVEVDKPKTPPKKVLRLNASGKFSSPISKKPKNENSTQASPGAPKRRGRPRKAKEAAEVKKLVVVLTYSNDESKRAEIGEELNSILSGEERVPLPIDKRASSKKPRTPRKPKATHPFFTGKPKDPPKPESPRKTAATTPGKLKMQVLSDKQPAFTPVPEVWVPSLQKDRLMVKHPGAREPLWPDRDQTHVRGLEDEEPLAPPQSVFRRRKRKAAKFPFPPEESILRSYGSQLAPEEEGRVRPDGFTDPHPSLRLPDKLLISGYDVRQRIAPELVATFPNEDDDELALPTSSQLSAHPGLQKLWRALPNTLTAFDECRGEMHGWAQKYAPTSAGEVLQPAREMTVLKDWLTSLTVSAVESTGPPPSKGVSKAEPKPKKKRRRKPDDLDDFLVDSDEDVHNMDELTDPEDVAADASSKPLRSIVQMPSDGAKLSNAVLLSGPHGCGKTAAAYAVARELGFKVFEISSSDRRSGKDVLDRVGDMTENHLVKHHGVAGAIDPGELSAADEPNKERLDEAFQKDLASGKQGKLGAFFKSSAPKAKPKPAAPANSTTSTVAKQKTLKAVEQALKKPAKDQQQSLILLEEVDILFKDDKEFWTTILKLILSSKRPFIMTCNDEGLVPLQAMNLHAILRFTPPPADLAMDYLLLVAAAEGHLLKRAAVISLYMAKGHDLRASITELDFWCQMGVGDPCGGLGWLYQRWPPASDIDGCSRKLRVVSQGTFQSGMGVLPESQPSQEDQMMWAWREHGVEPTDWSQPSAAEPNTSEADMNVEQRLASLKQHARLADTLSSVDAFATRGLPEIAHLDTTQPEMTDKQRQQYIEGLPLLQADEQVDYDGLSMEMVVASVCALSNVQRPSQPLASPDVLQAAITAKSKSATDQALTRADFAVFDPISTALESVLASHPGLTASCFDGPLAPIATDIAPYVRSIVQYDLALAEQRERLDSITGEGEGRKAKRARTTRAARSALEGSLRASTRRERWFKVKTFDLQGVLATGGSEWPKATIGRPESAADSDVVDGEVRDGTEPPDSSAETS